MLNQFTFRLCAVCAVMLCTVGCNAFNDHNKEGEILLSEGVFDQKPEGDEGTKPPADEKPADEEVAPPVPKVVCKINASIVARMVEDGEAIPTIGYPPSTTSARWIDDNTTMITTVVDDSKLVMTIQKQADGSFGLCDAVYSQGEESFTVTGGEVLVLQFNRSEDKKIINEGLYTLTLAPSTEATKAAQILLGKAATAPKATTASGHYYSESLIIVAE